MSIANLLDLAEGNLLMFDYPVGREVDLSVNGALRYSGRIVAAGRRRAFQIEAAKTPPQGRIRGDPGPDGSSGSPASD